MINTGFAKNGKITEEQFNEDMKIFRKRYRKVFQVNQFDDLKELFKLTPQETRELFQEWNAASPKPLFREADIKFFLKHLREKINALI